MIVITFARRSRHEMNPEELVNEMAATRKAIAIYLKRLLAVEEKIDRFTTEKEQYWKDQQARRRERTWR
jgi:hypothetical protein